MASWERHIARAASRLEDRLDGLKRRIRERDALRIVAYRGFGTADEVQVSGRVQADHPPPEARAGDPWWRNLAATIQRLETDEVPGVTVEVRFAGATRRAVTDREGYFRAWIRPAEPLGERLWQRAAVTLHDPASAARAEVEAEVMIPPLSASYGVISDLDDTVVRTNVRHPLRVARGVLLGSARTRLPFPGVAAFYNALHAGSGGEDWNPIFYLSSGPWNLHDVLVEFLDLHEIPRGPLLLRDWGITERSILPADHRTHKIEHIRHILATFPLPFILIGDSGQKDPEIYREAVAEHPDRILAIYIRNVSPDPLRQIRIRELAREVERAGSTLVLSEDTVGAVRHAAAHGWIRDAEIDRVASEPEVRQSREKHDGRPHVPTVAVEAGRRTVLEES